jgi:hypothetical protein
MQLNCSFAMLPPHDCNPTTRMWRWMANNQILKLKMYEYFRLVELAIVMVLGSVEDERTFFTFIFMKSKLKNQLTNHFDLVMKMYTQDFFTLQSFPFYMATIEWNEKKYAMGWSYKLCMQYGTFWFVNSVCK